VASEDSKPNPRNPLGPVGNYVVENFNDLLNDRGLSYAELSALLAKLGRPIPPLGVSRIAKGNRRVDVDDLVAIAIALRVNPSALLLPRHGGMDDVIELTPEVKRSLSRAWRWMDGAGPLPASEDEAMSWQEIADFAVHARLKGAELPEAIQELVDKYGGADGRQ
jgi:hypothetical protein